MGCTCFMNAGLQCLSHLDPLVEYFLSGSYKEDVHQGGKLAHAFADLQQSLWMPGNKVFEPRRLHSELNEQIGGLFPLYEEHDAQEFLSFFLDSLHEDINRVQVRPSPLSEADQANDEVLAEKHGEEFAAALAWKRHLECSKSFLVDLLQGQQRSCLTCLNCGFQSRRFDPFLYLSLPVDRSTGTVGDALKSYLAEEILEGDDGWRCPRCCKKGDPPRKASKKTDLWKLPPVLVVHLKRFAFDRRTCQLRKIDTLVRAPGQLDLSELCSSEQKFGAAYSLSCVANHLGNIGGRGGHYTAHCRVGSGGPWYEFNDRHVRQLESGRSPVTREAYVLFFVRAQARATLGPTASLRPMKGLPTRQTLSRPDQWPHIISTRASLVDDLMRARQKSLKVTPQDGLDDPPGRPFLEGILSLQCFCASRPPKQDEGAVADLWEWLESQDETEARRLQEEEDERFARQMQEMQDQTSARLVQKREDSDISELSNDAELAQSLQQEEWDTRGSEHACDAELAQALQRQEWETNAGTGQASGNSRDGSQRKQREEALAERPPAVFQGWMSKRGPSASYGWRRFWCVARPGVLECYVAEDCAEKKSEIVLPATARVTAFTASDAPSDAIKHRRDYKFGFVLDQQPSAGRERRVFYFDPGSKEALQRWTRALEEASGAARTARKA